MARLIKVKSTWSFQIVTANILFMLSHSWICILIIRHYFKVPETNLKSFKLPWGLAFGKINASFGSLVIFPVQDSMWLDTSLSYRFPKRLSGTRPLLGPVMISILSQAKFPLNISVCLLPSFIMRISQRALVVSSMFWKSHSNLC